jgi:hypothetical protein
MRRIVIDRVYRRMLIAFVVSLFGLWLVGRAVLWLYPPTELDRKCLGKTATELWACTHDRPSRETQK